jgi:hypothetical protein
VAVTVEILPAAQRQLDAADERWVDEHGLFADNPLFEQISHARTLLADNPQLGNWRHSRCGSKAGAAERPLLCPGRSSPGNY